MEGVRIFQFPFLETDSPVRDLGESLPCTAPSNFKHVLDFSFIFLKLCKAVLTPQMVRPVVRGFTQRWNCLKGCLISSEVWYSNHTTDGINCSYRH